MRYAFAGDRDISVAVLNLLLQAGHKPLALMVSERSKATHAEELIQLSELGDEFIFHGNQFKEAANIEQLKALQLDYIIGIHFPYLVPKAALDIPKVGFLNLHPAYLPYNKGWHTPSWAIMDGTPYGATLHLMTQELDGGDVIAQKQYPVSYADTADSLYKKVKQCEVELFSEALPSLVSLVPPVTAQIGTGTSHVKKDLASIQEINLDEPILQKQLINKLRALTTNNVQEAAYFVHDSKKYAVQVTIIELPI